MGIVERKMFKFNSTPMWHLRLIEGRLTELMDQYEALATQVEADGEDHRRITHARFVEFVNAQNVELEDLLTSTKVRPQQKLDLEDLPISTEVRPRPFSDLEVLPSSPSGYDDWMSMLTASGSFELDND